MKNSDKVPIMENSSEVLDWACKTIVMCLALSDGRRVWLIVLGNTDEQEYEFGVEQISNEGKRGRVRLVIFGSSDERSMSLAPRRFSMRKERKSPTGHP